MKSLTNEFTGKSILFTGKMHLVYTDKNSKRPMYFLLCEVAGANVKTGVSKILDFVVIGAEPGPSKLNKIENYNNDGCNIKVITEEEFIRRYFELKVLPPYMNFYY